MVDFSSLDTDAQVALLTEHASEVLKHYELGEVTEIDVRFEPTAAGTTITIHHSGFTSQESVTNHDGGWDGYMMDLGDFLSANTSR